MCDFCYTIAIRQITCQNGIPRNIDNVYTNITSGSTIPLSFGYNATFISGTNNRASIQISNPNFIPNLIFNIANNTYKIFDLPKESGTLRVYIGVTIIDCTDTVICCNV